MTGLYVFDGSAGDIDPSKPNQGLPAKVFTPPHAPDAPAYLGSVEVPIEQSPYKDFFGAHWVLEVVGRYGQIDGDHHKAWVIDQVARITLGARPKISKRSWANGHVEWDFVFEDSHPSMERYHAWVKEHCGPDANGDTYEWDVGIPP